MPVELIDIIKPKNNAQFPMVEDVDFKGGLRCVQDITHRNAVPTLNRKPNMFVYTQNEDKLWRWSSPWIDNTSWIEIPLGASGKFDSGEQGLSLRREILDLITSVPLVSDFREENTVAEYSSIARIKTWVPIAATTLASGFTMPAIYSTVSMTLTDGYAYSILTTPAQIMFVETAGYFRVDSVSGNVVDGYNLGTYAGFSPNASPGTSISSSVNVNLPFGNFADSILFGGADGSAFAFDEFSGMEVFSAFAGSTALAVVATRDDIISGGSQTGNTFLIRRKANSGQVANVSGPTGTLGGGAVVVGAGFDNFPTVVRTVGQWVWFSSPSDGKIWTYGLDATSSIVQADPGGLVKPYGMVITDDGYMWVCDRQDDTSANATITPYLPSSTGFLNGTGLGNITGFLSQCQIVYTGRFIFGLDCSGAHAKLMRFDPQTNNIDSYTLPTAGTPDSSSIHFDGLTLWATTNNSVYRIDPSSYTILYSYTDPVSTILYGLITSTSSDTSLLITFVNTANSEVGVRKFAQRKIIDTDRLRITSIAGNSGVITNAYGELIAGQPPITLSGDVIHTATNNLINTIGGVGAPAAGTGDDLKAITYDELNNRFVMREIGAPTWEASTVDAGIVNTIKIEGQNAPMIAHDTGAGSVVAFHKPSFGHDTFSMQPEYRWPSRSRGMELYLASSTATDLIFADGYLAVLHSSIDDFPITLHDPGSGQQVSQLPNSSIGSSGWDSIYFATQEKITDGTAPNDPYLYLQKSGTNEMARVNIRDGSFDLISSPSTTNGPIYVHESGIVAWMAGGSLVYTAAPCGPTTPTITTSSLTGKDSDAASSLVVAPSVYNVSFSQAGFMPRAWITQPLSETLIDCDFPFGTNDGYVSYNYSDGYTRPRQIAFDGTFLLVNAMTTTYPGDSTTLGEVARFDPVNRKFADHDDASQGCSYNGTLIADGKFIIASDKTKTNSDVLTGNQDSIHIRSSNFPIVATANGAARMGGLRIATPSKIITPRDGSQFLNLYAIGGSDIPGIYRYIDRPALFAKSINLSGGFIDHVERTDGYYNVSSFDSTVVLHDLNQDITLTLPNIPVLGQTFTFVDEDGSLGVYAATIDGNGTDINGAPVYIMGGSLILARQAITIRFLGNSWGLV